MLVIPALDLRAGECVHPGLSTHVNGRDRLGGPVATARVWSQLGFRRLHVVDVDAAIGAGSNAGVIEEVIRDASADVQVGGGVRSTDSVQRLFEAGASRIVVGRRALDEPEWLADIAHLFPGVVIVATDVRARRVVMRGWVRSVPLDLIDVVEDLNGLPLGGMLVTSLNVGETSAGTDLALMEDVAEAATFPVLVAGGVATLKDLRALEHRGVTAVVAGAVLYSGALDARAVGQEFGE